MTNDVAPGVYFGMTDDAYHGLPYLSSTGMKNLLVSGMDFWARSWMNPYKEEDEEESEAKTIGKAYHKRILEGRAAFYEAYAPVLTVDDPEVLKDKEDLQAALRERGLPVSGNKAELINRLLGADPFVKIYDQLHAEYAEEHLGKTMIGEDTIRKIELAAQMIECHAALKFFFVGGFPEVSVIWDDEQYGVRMKARFDYLKVNAVNDLKTFANVMNKPTEKAVYSAMAQNKYHIQATHYLHASDVAKRLVHAGHIHAATPKHMPSKEWLDAFIASPEHNFNFVFQQKGPAPLAIGAVFDRRDGMYETGQLCIREAVDVYKRNMELYGTMPWVDTREPIVLHWQQYPAFASEL